MQCDYCHRDVDRVYPLLDWDFVEHICRLCLADVRHAAAGGRIPQEPPVAECLTRESQTLAQLALAARLWDDLLARRAENQEDA